MMHQLRLSSSGLNKMLPELVCLIETGMNNNGVIFLIAKSNERFAQT